MPCTISNPYQSPITLPAPLSRLLAPGQIITVPSSPSELEEIVPGISTILKVDDLPNYDGPFDTTELVGVPNLVKYINASGSSASTSLATAAPEIFALGSGQFLISAAACPYATGAPTVISFALFKDNVQLGPRHMNTDTGPGNHSPDIITWVDPVTDDLGHVYKLVATPQSGSIADSANHQWIVVYEL